MDAEPDPVVREVRALRRMVRTIGLATAVLYATLAVAVALTIYIRARDIDTAANKTATQAVSICFRDASQRPLWRDVWTDESLPGSIRNVAFVRWENTPTVRDCRQLANRLDVELPLDTNG